MALSEPRGRPRLRDPDCREELRVKTLTLIESCIRKSEGTRVLHGVARVRVEVTWPSTGTGEMGLEVPGGGVTGPSFLSRKTSLEQA